MVFLRGSVKEYRLNGVSLGTSGFATQSEWNKGEIFPNMLKHVIKNVACSKEMPQLIVIDNDQSQINFDVVDLARENTITVITFPLRCSHKMQPRDIAVSGPLKYYYKTAVNEWNLINTGKIFTIYDIPVCFVEAYRNTCNYQNIINGLKNEKLSTDPELFCEDDFLLSTAFEPILVTDKPPMAESEAMASAIEMNVDAFSEDVVPTIDEVWSRAPASACCSSNHEVCY